MGDHEARGAHLRSLRAPRASHRQRRTPAEGVSARAKECGVSPAACLPSCDALAARPSARALARMQRGLATRRRWRRCSSLRARRLAAPSFCPVVTILEESFGLLHLVLNLFLAGGAIPV